MDLPTYLSLQVEAVELVMQDTAEAAVLVAFYI
jgi:hypothetical protein